MSVFRALIFNTAYWLLSVLYVLMAAMALALPGRAVAWVVRRYSRRMVQAMRLMAGIRLKVVGRDRVPEGACIIAAKHHPGHGASRQSQGHGGHQHIED